LEVSEAKADGYAPFWKCGRVFYTPNHGLFVFGKMIIVGMVLDLAHQLGEL